MSTKTIEVKLPIGEWADICNTIGRVMIPKDGLPLLNIWQWAVGLNLGEQ